MFRLNKIALVIGAGVATAVSAADAADMPAPIPEVVLKGWYLRGDIGYSNQRVGELDNVLYDTLVSLDEVHRDFTGAPFLDAGIGYRWNKWFRTDITGEYRSKSEFNGADIYDNGGGPFPDSYTAKKSEWLALFNGYFDLGTWHGITPFVGAGVGAANVKIADFTDIGIGPGGPPPVPGGVPAMAFGATHDEWNFAWALYAGMAFDVTEAFTMELSYRYLDLGDGASGDLVAYDGTNTIDNPMEFNDITSHDLRLGFRYAFW